MATLFEMEPLGESGVKLNDAQKRAITHGKGPLLVIAGAGTGKTRVITERIRHLLETDASLSGENILGLTFTDKAAGEMKARVVKAVGERAKDVTLKTFHAFCESLLKDVDSDHLMLDKVDHWILLRRNLNRLQLDRYRRLAEPGQFLSDFIEFFSRCQDELVSCADYHRYAERLAAELEVERAELDADTLVEREETVAREREIARAYRASEELLREKKRSSFGALITGAVELPNAIRLFARCCKPGIATFSSTNFRIRTSRNCACWSFSPTTAGTSLPSATTTKPFIASEARRLAASNSFWSVSRDGAKAKILRPFGSASRKITARRQTSCALQARSSE